MRLLLDTHALLWMIFDDPRLSPTARQSIISASEIHWSTVSLWEIGIKVGLDRFDFELGLDWHERIPAELRKNGASEIRLEKEHCHAVSRLPLLHRDPFDRMLIAQAQTENLTFVTRDGLMSAYGVDCLW